MKMYDNHFQKTKRQVNYAFIIVLAILGFFWGSVGFFGYRFYSVASEIGVKKTFEIIWYGPDNSTLKGEK